MISWGLFHRDVFKNKLPVDSATIYIYSVIAEMETLTKAYVTETILNAASANPSHWGDVSRGGQHRNATMLDLGCTTSLEVLHASVGRKACGIPETHGRLHAEFILEGGQVDLYDRAGQC